LQESLGIGDQKGWNRYALWGGKGGEGYERWRRDVNGRGGRDVGEVEERRGERRGFLTEWESLNGWLHVHPEE